MKSPISYVGGKSQLAHRIMPSIPSHKTYCEVFCGAGWVFFSKEPSQYEVLNDLDRDLICFYRVVQHHLEEFLKQFKWLLSSRQLFHEWQQQLQVDGWTDIQRAARYYYLQRHAFGGRVRTRTFGMAAQRRPRINLLRIEEDMSEVYLRLQGVVVENLPYQACLQRYDKPETFFYLDPPYYQCPYYKHNFTHDDFVQLADSLTPLKGTFLLSLNDVPQIRDIFAAFEMKPVTLRYSISKAKRTEGQELLIANYPLT